MGVTINMVPKDGGNSFTTYAFGRWGDVHTASDNLTAALRAQVLTPTLPLNVYDSALSVGGPIKRDKVWFYTTGRLANSRVQVAGVYFNKTQGTPVYTPDLTRPAYYEEPLRSGAGRLTWQASERNKLSVY